MSKYRTGFGGNSEIVTFFYSIFGHKVHQGMDPVQARKEAYDAVSLRYGISSGRLLNIIAEQNNSQNVNITAFRENVLSLMRDISDVNEEINNTLERNNLLLSLLKDCLEYVDR